LFFTQVERDKEWAGDCSAVIHATSALARRKPPGKTVRLKEVPLGFGVRQDIPGDKLDSPYVQPPLQDVLADEDYDRIREALGAKTDSSHRLLGYGEPPNGGDTCWSYAEQDHGAWRHLFTLNWDEPSGFEIADLGRLQLFISPQDLR